jgi:O-antigen biosynthesis protein
MTDHRYRELADRVSEERATLDRIRDDYQTITRSRFHALRMLWFSVKQLFGRSSPDDMYAVWSGGVAPSVARRGKAVRLDPGALAEMEVALVSAWNKRVAARAASATPIVTVIVPAFNHRDVTVRCLRSIADSWFESLDVQFVVVDDGSSDGTADAVTKLDGIDYLRSGKNEGFIRACNRGAALARGKYLCFLNNDTVVRDGWLDHLVTAAESDPQIGVVGAKLLFPDGRLQEAGGIIWRDGTGWNVGRFESPQDPLYNYRRDVDYVSGAALLVRRELFERLGGFSDTFAPAYYEDVDLCFGARSLGYRVVYEPQSAVVHYEGVSAGNESSGTKRFQEINRPKFRQKWSAELDRHLDNDRANVSAAARRGGRGRTVLMIDSYVPLYDREAGSQRIHHIVRMLRQSGYDVVFLPDNYAALQPYTLELQQLGVEVLHHVDGGRTLNEALDRVLPSIDFAWISRPDLFQKYEPLVRRNGAIRVIYDTVDLGYIRKRREAALLAEGDAEWQELRRVEIDAARRADATVVVTAIEKEALEELGIPNIFVIPTLHEAIVSGGRRYEGTAGLLFIANYNHRPNVDAAQWLNDWVMPLVWKTLPDVSVVLLGSNPTPEILALRSERVRVTGYVRDVSMYFQDSRLFVAPLRFGAGMKGKIGQALQYALPVVTTPVGAEGLGLRDGENAAIAEAEPEAFAAAIVALYGDKDRWLQISGANAATLAPFTPAAIAPELLSIFERVSSLQSA